MQPPGQFRAVVSNLCS